MKKKITCMFMSAAMAFSFIAQTALPVFAVDNTEQSAELTAESDITASVYSETDNQPADSSIQVTDNIITSSDILNAAEDASVTDEEYFSVIFYFDDYAEPVTEIYAANTEISSGPCYIPDGIIVEGWYTEPEFTNRISETNPYIVTEDATLYALCEICDADDEYVIPYSGECGNGLVWAFDGETGTLTISGNGVMYDCHYDYAPWLDLRQKIKSVIVEEGVTGIGQCAFYDCTLLENVLLPEGLEYMDTQAFYNCGLTEITLPETISRIGISAFKSCDKLKSIEVPDTVYQIGDAAFADCTSLINVVLPAGLTRICEDTFSNCENLLDITVPDTVTEIDCNAFANCTSLERAVLPAELAAISDNLFSGCTKLTSISIPDSVLTIGSKKTVKITVNIAQHNKAQFTEKIMLTAPANAVTDNTDNTPVLTWGKSIQLKATVLPSKGKNKAIGYEVVAKDTGLAAEGVTIKNGKLSVSKASFKLTPFTGTVIVRAYLMDYHKIDGSSYTAIEDFMEIYIKATNTLR